MARWGRRWLWSGRIRTVRFQPSGRLRPSKPVRPYRSKSTLFGGASRPAPRPKRWTSGGAKRVPTLGSGRPTGFRMRKRTVALILLVLFILSGTLTASYVDRHLGPPLMNVAMLRVKQVATQAINKSISEQVASKSDFDKLVDWKMNKDGKISGFMLNYAEHMRITSETINTVQKTLDEIGAIPEHVPLGQALGSTFISSYGPRIPVKFEPVGSVKVDLNTRQQDAGINMILVEVYIRIEAEVAIIIPFDTKPEVVTTDIPISYLLVVGDVPMYYYDNKGRPVGDSAADAPNIALPGVGTGNGAQIGADASKQEGAEAPTDDSSISTGGGIEEQAEDEAQ
ncbi:sporulation protein YunB [Paenibacillus curdlanolyticus YK9]|uniref:Sporulation protein YunB n=1 Tax=Paenibacillus curdlanolyticus YK9 TaxID=717606 RepID=E0I6V8_9BACL|nr:sporulation protein YunB [Paenibacillus curdlanolyticus]EFM11774.1 sporulation protein YunB [Paenibacillus curdlanolyticus YK9]